MIDKKLDLEKFKEAVFNHPEMTDKVPDEIGLSYPVPNPNLNDVNKLSFSFFYFYMKPIEENKFQLSSPQYKSTVQYDPVLILNLEKTDSSSFGINWDDSKMVGVFEGDATKSYDEQYKVIKDYYSALNIVVVLYYNNKDELSLEQVEQVKAFNSSFNKAIFTPLVPYYKAMNKDFFQWVESTVKK